MKITQKTKIIFSVAAALLLITPLFLKQEKEAFDISEVYNTHSVKASLINVKNVNAVYIKCKFRNAGVLHNTLKNHGISIILAETIFQKTAGLSSNETSQKLHELGIRNLHAEAYGDDFEISFLVSKNHIDDALKFLAPCIVHPAIPENDLEQMKRTYPNIIDLETSSAEAVLLDELLQMLYPKHTYGLNITGSAQAINSLTSADLYDFIEKNFTKSRAGVTIVGDISRFDAAQYLGMLMGDIPEGENPEINFDAPQNEENEKKLYRKDMRDAVGIAWGIRLDGLSDLETAAAKITIKTLFNPDGDFSSSLQKENIAAVNEAALYKRRYSSIFYIISYVRKKDAAKFIGFLKNKLTKYAATQNLRHLEAYQKYYEELSKTGAKNFADACRQITEKNLPYHTVSPKDFSEISKKLFDASRAKIITLSSD